MLQHLKKGDDTINLKVIGANIESSKVYREKYCRKGKLCQFGGEAIRVHENIAIFGIEEVLKFATMVLFCKLDHFKGVTLILV